MAAKGRVRVGSARARGLRTLQHQTLAANVRRAIEAEVWLRQLLVGSDPYRQLGTSWATKDQVHDEALAWFLDAHARRAPPDYPARPTADDDVTFWLDSALMQRARRMAARDGIKIARLIDAAFTGYVRQCLPAELLEFHERTGEQAQALYARLRGKRIPAAAPTRPGKRRGNRRTMSR